LFGTQWEDMTSKAMLSIDTTRTGLEDMTGSMALMNEQGKTTAQEQAAAMNQIMLALNPLADAFNDLIVTYLVPIIQEYAPVLAEWLGSNLPTATSNLKSGLNTLLPFVQFAIDGFKTMWAAIKLLVSIVDVFIGIAVNLVAALKGVISPAAAVKNIIGDVKEVFENAIDSVASLNKQVLGLIKNLTGMKPPQWLTDAGDGVKELLGFADGGTFTGGKPILVGERGPEVIVPRASGTVIPNESIAGRTNNITMSVDVHGNANDSTIAQIEQVLNRSVDKLIAQGNI
jgi:hypothetical protein